jgi:hypothetical protein
MAKQMQPGEFIALLQAPGVADAFARVLTPLLEASWEKKFGDQLRRHESSIIALQTSQEDLVADNTRLRLRALEAELRLDELETASRAGSLIIKGLPSGSYADSATSSVDGAGNTSVAGTGSDIAHKAVESAVIRFCKERLSVEVSPSDITSAYRMKENKSTKKDVPRPIMVTFGNRRVRDEIFRAKKTLKPSGDRRSRHDDQPVYISEYLTPVANSMYFEARQRLKGKKLHAAWTNNGRVYVKFVEDSNERPTWIRSVRDFKD